MYNDYFLLQNYLPPKFNRLFLQHIQISPFSTSYTHSSDKQWNKFEFHMSASQMNGTNSTTDIQSSDNFHIGIEHICNQIEYVITKSIYTARKENWKYFWCYNVHVTIEPYLFIWFANEFCMSKKEKQCLVVPEVFFS